VCSTDDFFMQFKGSTTMQYAFDAAGLRANEVKNQARVRLAMELGIEPLYIDNANLRLSDMQPYVALADRMGYVSSVVSPQEICRTWDVVDVLTERSKAKHRMTTDKYIGRLALEHMVKSFESLPDAPADPRPPIRAVPAADELEGRFGSRPSDWNTILPPSALLYKFETLLKDGENLVRYTPPGGNDWGVNGELDEDWHCFLEKADGSCTYESGVTWRTLTPDEGWSFTELAWLRKLKEVDAAEVPTQNLPSATSHPAFFTAGERAPQSQKGLAAAVAAPSTPPDVGTGADVPTSRAERLRQRMEANDEGRATNPLRAMALAAKDPVCVVGFFDFWIFGF